MPLKKRLISVLYLIHILPIPQLIPKPYQAVLKLKQQCKSWCKSNSEDKAN